MPPRTAKPMPAAMSVMKLAKKIRFWLRASSGPSRIPPRTPAVIRHVISRSAFGLMGPGSLFRLVREMIPHRLGRIAAYHPHSLPEFK